jgi:hypothetical protein
MTEKCECQYVSQYILLSIRNFLQSIVDAEIRHIGLQKKMFVTIILNSYNDTAAKVSIKSICEADPLAHHLSKSGDSGMRRSSLARSRHNRIGHDPCPPQSSLLQIRHTTWQQSCCWLCCLILTMAILSTLSGANTAYARQGPTRRDRRPDRELHIRYPRMRPQSNNSGSILHSAPSASEPTSTNSNNASAAPVQTSSTEAE